MTNKPLSYYINRYEEGNLNADERILLAEMLRAPENREELQRLLNSDWAFWEGLDLDLPESYAQVKKGVFEKIGQSGATAAPAAVVRMSPGRRSWMAVASIILLLVIGGYFWKTGNKKDNTIARLRTGQVQPGKEGAILTLADGSRILLDTVRNGMMTLPGAVSAKVVNGTLVYEGNGNEMVYHTMSTPKGRQFRVILPDGTTVWLNAASSIRYPVVFAGAERKVEITGEAYFEVKKATVPFIVNADKRAEITVLGTRFNINSYGDEINLNTTLLEGAVRVSNGTEGIVIRPGQQVQVPNVTEKKAMHVVDAADTEKTMAWKNGLFNFEGATLREIMRQLERWYDIEVVYEKGVANPEFLGEIARDLPLKDILDVLVKSEVHFRLEGRKLIVLP